MGEGPVRVELRLKLQPIRASPFSEWSATIVALDLRMSSDMSHRHTVEKPHPCHKNLNPFSGLTSQEAHRSRVELQMPRHFPCQGARAGVKGCVALSGMVSALPNDLHHAVAVGGRATRRPALPVDVSLRLPPIEVAL
jgi:hypothetical protein